MPWPLATPEGLFGKTNNAILADHLQKDVPTAESIPTYSATIIDGMHLVQKLKGDQLNFGEIATYLFSMIMKEGSGSERIDVVFDKYQQLSIKDSEKQLRRSDAVIKVHSINAATIIRQWRKFLGQMSNKTSLISFLASEWKKSKYTER